MQASSSTLYTTSPCVFSSFVRDNHSTLLRHNIINLPLFLWHFFSEAKIYIYNKLKKEQKYHTKNLKKEFNESTKHTERELNYATYSPIYVFINHNH